MAAKTDNFEGAAQLPLSLPLDEQATFENFLACGAAATVSNALRYGGSEPLQFLHGPSAVGKTHLLQASCQRETAALYLPLGELQQASPSELFTALERASLIALDDIQLICGRADWEEALFHLMNRCRASRCRLLLAAREPAASLGVQLPDLRSRLAGGVTWGLPPYSDADKAAILRLRAARRGLDLPAAVCDYLSRRASRALPDLLAILERLDRASLQTRRPLTVPLVREVMGW